MNLENFTHLIDYIIVERGKEIHNCELYSDFKKEGHTYSMIAHGTYDYDVSVTLDETLNVVDHHCDCPYDFNPVCKHRAALLFLIREDPLNETGEESDVQAKGTMETIIKGLERSTLESILLKQTYNNPSLYKALLFRYSGDDEKISAAYSTVHEALKWVDTYFFDDEEFDDAWGDSQLEINRIFDEALREDTPFELGARLLNAVLSACMEDDVLESDYSGFIMDDTFGVFEELASKTSEDNSSSKAVYEVMMDFYTENKEDVLILTNGQYLRIIAMLHADAYKDDFYQLLLHLENEESVQLSLLETIQLAMYEHLSSLYDKETSKAYLHARLEHTSFLEMAYERAMEESEYEMALTCAESLIEKTNTRWLKKPYEWWLIKALLAKGDTEMAKPVLFSLLLRGDKEAFETYESLYDKEAFEGEVTRILDQLKMSRVSDDLFIEIASKYQRHKDLMGYAEYYPSSIGLAYPHIPPLYEDRVYQVFRTLVFERAMTAHKRGAYRDIARIIAHAKKAVGEKATKIEKDLLSTYPRKTALKDEVLKSK